MHIIGGHDYYDCMLAYGRDMDIVFVRDGRKVPLHLKREQADDGFNAIRSFNDVVHIRYNDKYVRQNMWPRADWIEVDGDPRVQYDVITVIVADTLYRGLRVYVTRDKGRVYAHSALAHCVWNDEQLDKLVPNLKVKPAMARWWVESTKPAIEGSYFGSTKLSQNQLDVMIENHIAVAVIDTSAKDVVLNGDQLKSVGFYRVLDPLQCYTILYDWIGGVLSTNANRMVTITDPKILLKKHGMDATSFRKAKGEK